MKMVEALSLIFISFIFFTAAAEQQNAIEPVTSQFCGHIEPFSSAIHKESINQSYNASIFAANLPEKQVDVGLTLISPDGTKIDQNTNTSYIKFQKNSTENSTYEYYVIQNPAVGVWSFELNASSMPVSNGSDYCLELINIEEPKAANS